MLREQQWLLVAALALLALVLGVWGGRGGFADRLYVALQLFPLSGSTAGEESAAFQVARFLAPAVFLFATISAVYALFHERFQEARARVAREHVIVCGLGRHGARVVSAFLPEHAVVALERDPSNPHISSLREEGAIVLVADAREVRSLRRARIDRAQRVVAVCGPDDVNAEVALAAAAAAADREARLPVLVRLQDTRLSSLLAHRLPAAAGAAVEFFDVFERGARAVLAKHPPEATASPHLLVLGLGRLGQAVVALAAHGWYLRATPGSGRLPISVVDRRATAIVDRLYERYSRLEATCDVRAYELDADSDQLDRLLDSEARLRDVSAVYVCFDDDARSVNAALALERQQGLRPEVVVVRVADAGGGLALLLRRHATSDAELRVEPFSLVDETWSGESLRLGVLDVLAREIHASYLRSGASGPAAQDWSELDDAEREANVAHAAAMKEQLEAVGYRLGPLLDWGAPLERLPDDAIETMARLEHERWVAEHVREGWRHGPVRDDDRKEHPDLVDWASLGEAARRLNRDLVAERPAMLARVGIGLFRRERTGGGVDEDAAQAHA
jgi:voltage-gated potassium channel Kch